MTEGGADPGVELHNGDWVCSRECYDQAEPAWYTACENDPKGVPAVSTCPKTAWQRCSDRGAPEPAVTAAWVHKMRTDRNLTRKPFTTWVETCTELGLVAACDACAARQGADGIGNPCQVCRGGTYRRISMTRGE